MTNKNIKKNLDKQKQRLQSDVFNILDVLKFVSVMERTINRGNAVIYFAFRNFIDKELDE